MESYQKPGRPVLKFVILLTAIILIYLLVFSFFKQKPQVETQISNTPTPTKVEDKPNIITPKPVITPNTFNGIKMLYPAKENGRAWYSKWTSGGNRKLTSGERDPFDSDLIARGNGSVTIENGIARFQGESPRMYVYDPGKAKKWNNVEVTIYAKRVSESGSVSSQGIVIGARSEHQDATIEKPCLGATYYGRLLYDGRAVFQKEVIHEGAYSVNKPIEDNMATWNTADGTMPKNIWIGVKFVVKTNSDMKSVKLELYRDLTDGRNGGSWKKVAEYTDSGDWSQTDSNADVMKTCGYPSNKILINPGTSVFVRNDKIEDVQYKLFSIIEI